MPGGLRHLRSAHIQHLRLTHPEVDFWVDVRLREFDGRWLAVADRADDPDVGTGTGPREALLEALVALGPRVAQEMVAAAPLEGEAMMQS